ncbi:MAG TPA: hypothetical protein VK845_11025 [Gemmatimonadales bacterium]|nr:hypothetical protein [Gemmatimonadales bacterium]
MLRDFSDLISAFNAHGVEHIVVGAHALAAHGHVRATKDLDIWVRPDRENAGRVLQALTAFGAPIDNLTEHELSEPGLVFQIGIAPVRIDLVTAIDGVSFDEAWSERVVTQFGGEETAVLSRRHLIRNKRSTGRLQDLADVERLEAIARERPEAGQ